MNDILDLLKSLWSSNKETLRMLRDTLIVVIIATVIGSLSILIFRPTIEHAYWFPGICWVFAAYRLFSIGRYIRIHITGEGLEAIHLTSNQPGVLNNELAKLYWKIITNVFLAQTMIFLSLPVYINYTEGKASLLLPAMMILVAISIANWKSATAVFRFIGTIVIIVFLAEFMFGFMPNIKSALVKRAGKTEVAVAKFIDPATDGQKSENGTSLSENTPVRVPYIAGAGSIMGNKITYTPNSWNSAKGTAKLLCTLESFSGYIQAFGGYNQKTKSGKFVFIPTEGSPLDFGKEYTSICPFPKQKTGKVFITMVYIDPDSGLERSDDIIIGGEKTQLPTIIGSVKIYGNVNMAGAKGDVVVPCTNANNKNFSENEGEIIFTLTES
ncbi:MAG: Uncharacterized protein Athens071425_339 [Parcubacteria group bacterium Athens0714_25]|nr:MAG: Uncharacterized protein Athens071425_339 [Parcubacteria group bacterium Athens0714_25]